MMATDLEDFDGAWNQRQSKFLTAKSWFHMFLHPNLLAPAPDVGALSTHVGTSDEMKSRPEVVDLTSTSKHWKIRWRLSLLLSGSLFFWSIEILGRSHITPLSKLMSRNESRCISRLFATKLWLSALRAFWYPSFWFWETWELSTTKAGLLY